MSFAFLPFYTGDYLRDTGHLSPREHGVYILMLIWCWQREQPLPLNLERVHRIVHAVTKDDEQAVVFVIAEFWKKGDDGYHNPRLEYELTKANGRIDRGKAGAAGRWANHAKPMLDGCLVDAKPMLKPMLDGCLVDAKSMDTTTTTTTTPTTTPTTKRGKSENSGMHRVEARASRLPPSWVLPIEWSEWAVQDRRWTRQHVLNVAAQFHDHWLSKAGQDALKTDWFATWRNWCRREQQMRRGGNVAEENKQAARDWLSDSGPIIDGDAPDGTE